ncbi:MAG TPA: glycosyltransferase, partial [Candidatus Cloacimonadota bacterium]|nr:glycosyltransferase [Candidatus Cloacimonadota bacterium]
MRVLVISFNFAPYNVTGTFRILKFVKYMPENGITPIVITANQGNHHINNKLNEDIPKDCKVYRFKSLFPDAQETYSKKTYLYSGNKKSFTKRLVRVIKDIFLSPDVQITWVLFHLFKMSRIIKKEKINTVLITGAPFSLFVAGYWLKKLNRINLILDYRDCWQEDSGQKAQSPVRQYLNKVWETRVLKIADAVIATTSTILEVTSKGFNLPLKRVIPTGFDPQDFANISSPVVKHDAKFTFFYSGNFKPESPVYNPHIVLKSLAELAKDTALRFVVCGHVDNEIKAEYESKYPFIEFKGFLPRAELFQIAQQADAFIHFYYPNKLADTISFKLFEYNQYKKPIISINTKDSEVARFIHQSNIGFACENDNDTDIQTCFAKVLQMQIEDFQNNIKHEAIENYNLKNTCH